VTGAAATPGAARHRKRLELAGRLLTAAEALLETGMSYTQLSVEDLISAAGVSRSSFYKAFDGKGDLLHTWLDDITDEIEDAADAWFSLEAPRGPDEIRAALAISVQTYAPHAMLMTAAYESAPFDPAVRVAVDDIVARGSGAMRRHMKRGQRAGWVDPELPADDIALLVTAMNERGFQQLGRVEDPAFLERLLDAHAAFLWNALYAHAPARRAAA
jgi:AcrR family transcriptional regulator